MLQLRYLAALDRLPYYLNVLQSVESHGQARDAALHLDQLSAFCCRPRSRSKQSSGATGTEYVVVSKCVCQALDFVLCRCRNDRNLTYICLAIAGISSLQCACPQSPKRVTSKIHQRGLASLSAYEVSVLLGGPVNVVAFVSPFRKRKVS